MKDVVLEIKPVRQLVTPGPLTDGVLTFGTHEKVRAPATTEAKDVIRQERCATIHTGGTA